jgi:uncharacterized protein (DUF1800 family)
MEVSSILNTGKADPTLFFDTETDTSQLTGVSDSDPLLTGRGAHDIYNSRQSVRWPLHFANRLSFGATESLVQSIQDRGWQDTLEWQLEYESIDDGSLEELLNKNLPSLAASAQELIENEELKFKAARELIVASLYRQSFSQRQLFERMVEFWSDHFNVYIFDGPIRYLKTVEDREIIRPLAMTRFRDILHANAKSPAMLYYLDNYSNSALGPNENYARELMELHTLGVNGGYTEQDVLEVARALTGWTIRPRHGTFFFNSRAHDYGEKTILGVTIPAGGGISDGETVLDILADHPSTARFISTKLARRFVSDNPPESLVDKLAASFTATDGDVLSLLRTLFASREFWMNRETKTKRPIDFINSTVRTLGLAADRLVLRFISARLEALAQIPFGWHAPNGYADVAGYWTNASALINRWNTTSTAVRETPAETIKTWLGDAASPNEIITKMSAASLYRQIRRADKITILQTIFANLPAAQQLPSDKLDFYGRAVLIALLSSRHFQLR